MTIEIPDEIVKREDYKIKDFMLDIAVMSIKTSVFRWQKPRLL